MKICVLSSGSKGNATYLEIGNNKFLIDSGNSGTYIIKKLTEIGVDASDINAIFITHTHTDHIAGLRVFLKKYKPVVFLSETVYNELSNNIYIENYIIVKEKLDFNLASIDYIKTSHDAKGSLGYIFADADNSVVYITDTGYINAKYHAKLKNHSLYIMESNHDIDMLMNCSYPYQIKQRILGSSGHLSNKDSADYLARFIGERTKKIILAHLSEENNHPDLAYTELSETLKSIKQDNIEIIIAKQDERTELIEI